MVVMDKHRNWVVKYEEVITRYSTACIVPDYDDDGHDEYFPQPLITAHQAIADRTCDED